MGYRSRYDLLLHLFHTRRTIAMPWIFMIKIKICHAHFAYEICVCMEEAAA